MSRDYSSSSHGKLPSLHEVLGDVLEQRPSSRAASVEPSRRSVSATVMRLLEPCLIPYHYYHQHPSSTSSDRYASPDPAAYASRGRYGPSAASSSYHHHTSRDASSSSSSYVPQPQPPTGAPGHSYHLFNLVPEGLVHQKSSMRDDLDPSVPKPRLPASDPARKYVCHECGNRFSKQSTLRNHYLTHTGERPFACSYPGCGRRFSMACNMQRHMRTHTNASAFELDDEEWHSSGRGESTSREGSLARGGSPRDSERRRY